MSKPSKVLRHKPDCVGGPVVEEFSASGVPTRRCETCGRYKFVPNADGIRDETQQAQQPATYLRHAPDCAGEPVNAVTTPDGNTRWACTVCGGWKVVRPDDVTVAEKSQAAQQPRLASVAVPAPTVPIVYRAGLQPLPMANRDGIGAHHPGQVWKWDHNTGDYKEITNG